MDADMDDKAKYICEEFWLGLLNLYPELATIIGHEDEQLSKELDDYSLDGFTQKQVIVSCNLCIVCAYHVTFFVRIFHESTCRVKYPYKIF